MRFDEQKKKILADLQRANDRSPKGSLDEPIRCLIRDINHHEDYVTTSSCSGRISLFHVTRPTDEPEAREHLPAAVAASSYEAPKKGLGSWLLVKHSKLEECGAPGELARAIAGKSGFVTLKHEPFVMHILCRSLEAAQKVLQLAHRSGFRESGISLGKKKTVVAVRTTANLLEVPLVCNGKLVVSQGYLEILTKIANAKFDENLKKTTRFHVDLIEKVLGSGLRSGAWTDLRLEKGDPAWLVRKGNSAKVLNGKVIVFGGYGSGSLKRGTHQRLNDVLTLSLADEDPPSFVLEKPVVSGDPPSPRLRHSAAVLENRMVVFGGRESPLSPLNDAHVLVEAGHGSYTWIEIQVTSEQRPRKRWSHVVSDGLPVDGSSAMVVFGGRDEDQVLGDLWLLLLPARGDDDAQKGSWVMPTASGEAPCARFLCGSCTVNSKLIVYGGYRTLLSSSQATQPILDSVHVLDVSSQSKDQLSWSRVQTSSSIPRFSHQMLPCGKGRVLVVGGYAPTLFTEELTQILDYENGHWQSVNTSDKYGEWARNANRMFYSFAAVAVGNHTLILGGGALCFSFGSRFNQSCVASLESTVLGGTLTVSQPALPQVARDVEMKTSDPPDTLPPKSLLHAALIKPQDAKTFKTFLEKQGWYDSSRRIAKYRDTAFLAVPLTSEGVTKLQSEVPRKYEIVSLALPPARHMLRPESKQGMKLMKEKIIAILQLEVPSVNIDKLSEEIPTKFELLDDVAIVPSEAFSTDRVWRKVFSLGDRSPEHCVWRIITQHTGTQRVVKAARIDTGPMRESRAVLVYPRGNKQTCVVTVKQNRLLYRFDLTKCMFSSGNITEKQRVARFNCRNEVVVDLFAGIGYFTLPYLVHAKAMHVHACEWNPNAVSALRDNLALNCVTERCTVHVGDNKETSKKFYGVADRVNLGLIPSSEAAWETALRVLKPSGGWLHVHENVNERGLHEWKKYALQKLKRLSITVGRKWKFSCKHIERVKSYAPKLVHIVADIHCGCSIPSAVPRMLEISGHTESVIVQSYKLPCTKEECARLFARRQPIILTSAYEWDEIKFRDMIESNVDLGGQEVSMHVGRASTGGRLSFVDKNFDFKCMTLKEALQLCSGSDESYSYLRSVGRNPRKDRADFWRDYPGVSSHMGFPEKQDINKYCTGSDGPFSTVFRMASAGMQLWTHYDVMDNILFQTIGTKRVLIYHPEDVAGLYFKGSSSPITNIDDVSDSAYPLYKQARARAIEITLQPGQALFLPALWPHNVLSQTFSVAVNCFWKSLPNVMYSDKDLYGNRDPKPVERAYELLQQARKAMEEPVDGHLLPADFLSFYKHKAVASFLGNPPGS